MIKSGKELLSLVSVIANEKQIEKELVFESLENSLATALKKDYGKISLKVVINRDNGKLVVFQHQEVVADINWEDESQIKLSEAKKNDASKKIGDVIINQLPEKNMSRVTAQVFRQVVKQNLRNAERKTSEEHYSKEVGNLFMVTIKKFLKNDILVTLPDETEGVIPSSEQNGEKFRIGSKTLAVLERIETYKGHQLVFSKNSDNYLKGVLAKEIPAIGEENIEVIAIARNKGKRAKVVVRSLIAHVDEMRECIGSKGIRAKQVSELMNGEQIDFVSYSKDFGTYVSNLLNPLVVESVLIDESKNRTSIIVSEDSYSKYNNLLKANYSLITQILKDELKSDIWIVTAEEFEADRDEEDSKMIAIFEEELNVDTDLAMALIEEGFQDLEAIAYSPIQELLNIEGFDEELAQTLQRSALESLSKLEKNDLMDLKNVNSLILKSLQDNGIKDRESLAELAVDELLELVHMSEDEAKKLIMEAREIWFS